MGNLFSPATSVDAAKYHLEQWVLPRCIRDMYAEMLYFHKFGVNQKMYRRVLLDEEDRGILYPIWTTGIRLLAHFGIGVGIYFAQLLILSAVFFIGGIILSPAISIWQERDWLGANSTAYLATTAALPEPVWVQASEGCASNDGGTCDALFRSNTISKTAIACDLAMVLFVFVAIYVSKFYENKLKEDFDEAVQSAQDYAVYVADPSPSATDPDEWYKFFSRFGKVKYITVTKKNGKLKDLLKQKHLIVRNMCAIVGDTDNFYQKYYGGYTNLTGDDNYNTDDDDADFAEAERRKQIMQLFDMEENKEDDIQRRHDNMKRIYQRVQKYRNAGTSFSDSESDDDEVDENENEFISEVGKDAKNNLTIIGNNTNKATSNNSNNTTIGNSNSNNTGTIIGGENGTILNSSDTPKSIDQATILASVKARKLEFMNLEKLKKKLNKEKMLKLENELTAVNSKLSLAFKDEYEANQVYAIFDYEEHQRLALSELEVADIETADAANANSKLLFRGENVLKVAEPPEPDNVLWSNNEITTKERRFRNFLSRSTTIAMFVGCFYLVRYYQIKNDDPTTLAIIIGAIDAALPTIFLYLSNWEAQRNEGMRQESLQIKLFGTRLLLSTIFPYLNVPWNRFLDVSNIQQNFSVQIAACFTAPIIQLIDVATMTKRYLIGPMMSVEQKELNIVWSGVQWTLAEKYTNISKILFISLFYALLAPSTLFIAAGAFVLLFFIDRYLLLRRWEQPLLIDDAVAKRLRQQALIAVTAHAFVSLRFLYSWPMDSAYFNEEKSIYVKVNKEPLWNVFSFTEQVWHNEAQKELIPVYKIVTYFFIVFTLYVLFGEGIIYSIRKYFSKVVSYVGEAQGIPFSSLSRIPVYIPQVMVGNDKFMFADIRRCDKKHHPVIKKLQGSELPDLSVYVPRGRKSCLSVVKWYSDDYDDFLMNKQNKGNGNGINIDIDIDGSNTTSAPMASASGLLKTRKTTREKLVHRTADDEDNMGYDIELGNKLNNRSSATIGKGRQGRELKQERDSIVPGNNATGRVTMKLGDDDDDDDDISMNADPGVEKLKKYLHNFRTLQAQSRPSNKKALDSTTSSNSNSNSSSSSKSGSSMQVSSGKSSNSKNMDTTDILTSLRSLTRKIGGKNRQKEDEEIRGKLRTSITEYFRKFLATSSSAAYSSSNSKGKSIKIAPMDASKGHSADTTNQQYSERHLDSILDLRSSNNSQTFKTKPIVSSSYSLHAGGNTSSSISAREIDTAEINFDSDLDINDGNNNDYDNYDNNEGASGSRFGKEQRSYRSIKKVVLFNESMALTIPQFLERDDISLLREINKEFLSHDDFDPTSIFDQEFEDFISFRSFYDRLILLSPYAICVPEYTPPRSSSSSSTSHFRKRGKETPQEIIKKLELKLKLRQIFTQIIFIQKELLLNKSDVKSIIGENDLKEVEKSLEGAVSWKIFMSILFNVAVISQ